MLAGAGGPPKQPLAAVDYMLNILPAAEQRKATGRLREEGSFPLPFTADIAAPFNQKCKYLGLSERKILLLVSSFTLLSALCACSRLI